MTLIIYDIATKRVYADRLRAKPEQTKTEGKPFDKIRLLQGEQRLFDDLFSGPNVALCAAGTGPAWINDHLIDLLSDHTPVEVAQIWQAFVSGRRQVVKPFRLVVFTDRMIMTMDQNGVVRRDLYSVLKSSKHRCLTWGSGATPAQVLIDYLPLTPGQVIETIGRHPESRVSTDFTMAQLNHRRATARLYTAEQAAAKLHAETMRKK